jgi:hypothetical protein
MLRLLASLFVLAAIAAPSAGAVTSVGRTPLAPTASGGNCTSTTQCTFFQAADDGVNSYAVPSDGVITAYGIAEGSNLTGVNTAQLRIFRPAGGATWKIVGESAANPLWLGCCGALNVTLPARITVQPGDRIGVTVNYDGDTAWQVAAGAGNTVAQVSGVTPALGDTLVPLNLLATGNSHVNLVALVEPDADHDGFGDLTQDLCPGNPAHGDSGCSGYVLGSKFQVPLAGNTSCGLPSCVQGNSSLTDGTVSALARGVIVRWRVFGNGGAGDMNLKVLRPEGAMVRVAAESPTLSVAPSDYGIVTSAPTQIPIQAGDRIGVATTSGSYGVYQRLGIGHWETINPAPAVGSTATPAEISTQTELLQSADVEADVDGDGYGDETQDACPSDPAEHGGCPKPVITGFKFSPKKFAVKTGGSVLTPSKAKKGSAIALTLSKASHVEFVVNLKATGRTVGKKCVKPTRKNKTKKHCTYFSKFWPFARELPVGASKIPFSGRIKKGTKSQTLKPGTYVVSAYPLSALSRVGGSTAKTTFKVVPAVQHH